ncbi:MAG TPA: choice-of-anchor P family protein, partial [Acidimicrobiales bacterium]|nr:choice-of-anchor P family protein [Acidimicrobiales bacterium]
GLGILLGGPQDPVQSPLSQTLVSATAVESSAIARCVGDQALFDTDYSIVGLKVLGQDVGLEALLAPVVAGLDLDGIVSVKQGEAGPLPGGGIFVNALHIVIPLLGVDLIVGRSEARMPTPCAAGTEAEAVGQASPPASVVAGGAVTPLAATGRRSRLFHWGVAAIGAGLALRLSSRQWRSTCWSSLSPPCGRRQPWRRSDGTVGAPPT